MPRRRRFRPNLPLWGAVALCIGIIVAYIGLGTLFTVWGPVRPGVPRSSYLVFLARSLDATLALWFVAVGSSIGSFLNVVAYRLPRGKTLGGHSACPFCCTTIAASDNIPVFAWLALRGRCRTCRLPISIQYPLVELAVGLLFLFMYFAEFGIAGSNLPGSMPRPMGIGLIWMSVTPSLMVRMLLFLFLLSGLLSVALIVIRRSHPPFALFACLVLVNALVTAIQPDAVIIPWHGLTAAVPSHLSSLLTMVCGGLAGFFAAAMTLPLLGVSSNRSAWLGVAVCLGVAIGWQSVPTALVWILACSWLAGTLISQRYQLAPTEVGFRTLFDPAIWAWLGMVGFRANWKMTDVALRSLPGIPQWSAYLLPMILAVGLAWAIGRWGAHAAAIGSALAAAAAAERHEESLAEKLESEANPSTSIQSSIAVSSPGPSGEAATGEGANMGNSASEITAGWTEPEA